MEANDAALGIVSLIVMVAVAVMVLFFVTSMGGKTYQIMENNIEEIATHSGASQSFTALYNIPVSLDHSPVINGSVTIRQNATT